MKTLKEQFDEATQELASLQENLAKTRKEANRLDVEVRESAEKHLLVKSEALENTKKVNVLQRKIPQQIRAIGLLKNAIATQEVENRVDELLEKQKGFWEALESVLTAKQEETKDYMAGLSTPLAPERVIERLRFAIKGTNNFTKEAVDIRGCMTRYEQALKELIRLKVEGGFVSTLDGQRPKYILEKFLFKPHIERIWNVQ